MSPAPDGALHRCAWCGQASSSTTGPHARLVPMPTGMAEWLADYERRHGVRLRHNEYASSEPARWWCRSVAGCLRRRAGVAVLP